MKVAIRRLHDWYRLLRAVYNPGIKKHEPIHVLGCANCGRASADIREDEHAWDGWTAAPVDMCPECNESKWPKLPADGREYPGIEERRSQYLKQLDEVKNGGKHG